MDAVEELPTEKPKRIPHFTKENAKAYNVRAIEAKRLAAIEREQALERAKVVTELAPDEKYRLTSLARTRGLIEKLEDRLEKIGDPQALNYITSGLAKLRDIEQKLANRPLPGSRRPGRESTSKQPSTYEPSE